MFVHDDNHCVMLINSLLLCCFRTPVKFVCNDYQLNQHFHGCLPKHRDLFYL